MPIKRLSVGQRFHYTGDMANNPDDGVIMEVLEPTTYTQLRYRCQMDSGIDKIVEALSFEKSIGQRFKTIEQVEEEKQEKRRQMEEFFSKKPNQ